MSLDHKDVLGIAHLARLQVSEQDLGALASDLSNILHLVERMNQTDTADVEPMAHPTDAVQRLRADAVTESDQRDKFQALAPAAEDGLYLVPRVIE